MKNFKQDGETVTGIAPYDVTSAVASSSARCSASPSRAR